MGADVDDRLSVQCGVLLAVKLARLCGTAGGSTKMDLAGFDEFELLPERS